ncbi:hypothetical protein [Tardisphaera saccharovorans]
MSAGFLGGRRRSATRATSLGNVRTVYFLGLLELLRVKGLALIFESINAIPFLFTVLFPVRKVRMVHRVVTCDAIKMRVGSGVLLRAVNFLQLYVAPAICRSKVVTNANSTARELRALGYEDVSVVRTGVNFPARSAIENKEKLVVIPICAWTGGRCDRDPIRRRPVAKGSGAVFALRLGAWVCSCARCLAQAHEGSFTKLHKIARLTDPLVVALGLTYHRLPPSKRPALI